MLQENLSPARRLLALAVFGFVLSVFGLVLGPVEQAAALPPRPTDTPTPSPTSAVVAPNVGYIMLKPTGSASKIGWTVVQWQDGLGRWQTTGDGWQGTLDADGQKTWAVLTADLGKGPFRWVAYDKRNGKVVATSASFYLPKNTGEAVGVAITVK